MNVYIDRDEDCAADGTDCEFIDSSLKSIVCEFAAFLFCLVQRTQLNSTRVKQWNPKHFQVMNEIDVVSAQIENPLLLPPDQDSPSHILNALNDDCLYKAFKRLHFLDLLNVLKVCIRFEARAKEAFASKYKRLKLDIAECDRNTMEEILSAFGSAIQSLHVKLDPNAIDGDFIHTIIQNCSSELKELNLLGWNIQLDSPHLRLPFSKLETLGLFDCVGNLDLAHLIDDCPHLKEISLEQCDLRGVNEMIGRRFGQLETLKIYNCDMDIKTDALEHFIVSNPTLTELLIIQSDMRIETSQAFRLIGQNMLKLQLLHFCAPINDLEHFQSDVEHIGRLHSLKHLGLSIEELEVAPLANSLATNNIPIETLRICFSLIDDIAIRSISKLKRLTNLDIQCAQGFNEEHLINLARNVHGLEKLTLKNVMNHDGNGVPTVDVLMQMLHYAKKLHNLTLFLHDDEGGDGGNGAGTGFDINTDQFKTMLTTIKNRPVRIGLCIHIRGSNSKIDVPEAMLQENSAVLSIKIRQYE